MDLIPAQISVPEGSKRAFRVAAFGLSQRFLRMLDMILHHDRNTGRHLYQLADTRTPGEFDIALVNLTVAGGVDVARRLRSLPRALPVIGVGRRANRRRGADDLLFATFAQDILGVLDRAADSLTMRAQQQALFRSSLTPMVLREPMPEWDEMVSRHQLRILVIDASPSSRSHVAVGLRQLGIDAEGVGSLVQAADVLAMRSYDLIILDPRQPDGDGLEMLRRFKRATRSTVPVIVLSDRATLSDLLRSALAGCSGYLVKPLSVPALHGTVRRILLRHLHHRQRSASSAAALSGMAGKALLPSAVPAPRQAVPASWWGRVGTALAGMAAAPGRMLLSAGRRPAAASSEKAPLSRRSGTGGRIDSGQMSPSALPVWCPGSQPCCPGTGPDFGPPGSHGALFPCPPVQGGIGSLASRAAAARQLRALS